MVAETPQYSFRVVRTGDNTAPTSMLYCGEGFDQWEEFCYSMSVLQGGGKTVVINTGFAEDPSLLFNMWLSLSPKCRASRTEEQKPKNALVRLGIDPSKVDVLILSPLVAYATGNIDLFSSAQICILRDGWKDFFAPQPNLLRLPRDICIPPEQLNYLITKAWDRIRLLENEDEVLTGIETFFAGVHHRSSMAICVNTAKGKAIQSDCFFKYANIEKMKPIGVAESLFEAARSYKRIRDQADILVPPFDPELFHRHHDGIIA